jgi:hypothetical protein
VTALVGTGAAGRRRRQPGGSLPIGRRRLLKRGPHIASPQGLLFWFVLKSGKLVGGSVGAGGFRVGWEVKRVEGLVSAAVSWEVPGDIELLRGCISSLVGEVLRLRGEVIRLRRREKVFERLMGFVEKGVGDGRA